MWLKRQAACVAITAALAWANVSKAEVSLLESKGWNVSTDGRVNAFVSHVWGDNRPKGLENLNWVGFNESNSPGQANSDNKLRKTRIRSGYVPSTLAFNLRKEINPELRVTGRVEIGFQIANIDPTYIADPTWMDPRSVYLDLAGSWGSVRAGRDMSLFPRSNLFMNYELGHAYGVGFPCAYERMFGGACGHVGFGTLWPDYRAQITYSTPNFGNIFQVSVGAFDPRTVPTYSWDQTPLPRFEGEAVAKYNWREGWGIKAWGNGSYQTLGTSVNVTDPANPDTIVGRQDYSQSVYGVGGGLQAYLGPFKGGVSGYMGRGMDGFEMLTFNPIFVGQNTVKPEERRFRPSRGFLAEASFTLGKTWIMAGFGRVNLDRIDTDIPITTVDAFPLIRSQTGISAGVFHRIENVVLGLDYFNAHYGFDPRNVAAADGSTRYITVEQTVNIVNAGVTLEW
jgi:hypothetical protein